MQRSEKTKDKPMNPQIQKKAQRELSTYADIAVSETDLLAGWGFDPHEIASLRLPIAVVSDGRERSRHDGAVPGISATAGQQW
jgi:hypothetical protein